MYFIGLESPSKFVLKPQLNVPFLLSQSPTFQIKNQKKNLLSNSVQKNLFSESLMESYRNSGGG